MRLDLQTLVILKSNHLHQIQVCLLDTICPLSTLST